MVRTAQCAVILTDANICSNAAHITIGNSSGFQNFVHSGFTHFLIVKKRRIWINIGIVTFMDNLGLRMDLNKYAISNLNFTLNFQLRKNTIAVFYEKFRI